MFKLSASSKDNLTVKSGVKAYCYIAEGMYDYYLEACGYCCVGDLQR